jgi:acetate---CoA ligase (ADP-forming)
MATDAAIERGLELARFSPETTAKLKKALPAAANMKNPIDVIGDARDDRYRAAMEAVYADPSVDQILVILTPQSMTNITTIAQAVCDEQKCHADKQKPLLCSFMGAKDVAPGIQILQDHAIPHYILPEWACDAMEQAVRYRRWRDRKRTKTRVYEDVDRAKAAAVIDKASEGYLIEPLALKVLAAYGLPVVPSELTQTPDEAVAAADCVGYPVVLRVVSPNIVHKFDVKGVMLNLRDAGELRSACEEMREAVLRRFSSADIAGFLVRRMIPAGKEVILGISRDPVFGHVIMCGLGGIYVEALKDVTFRITPISEATATRMINSLRMASVLKGLRGEPPSDIPAIEDALKRLSQLACDFPKIAELDINPLIVHPAGEGCHVADVRIRLG